MARGNLAAARGAAARRGKSPTSEVDVRLDLQPVGTATEGSTLVRDLNPRPPEPHCDNCRISELVDAPVQSLLPNESLLMCDPATPCDPGLHVRDFPVV